MTNKRREMGNRAILSSSLLPFHNGKIVTLECACCATEDLPSLESEMIFFWDSTRVNWRMLFFLFLLHLPLCFSHIPRLSPFFIFFLLSAIGIRLLLLVFRVSFLSLFFRVVVLLVKSNLAQGSFLKP